MGDGANIGTALGSGAVDDQFRALVGEDEEWLDAALRGIVGGPAENPTAAPRRPVVSADQADPAGYGPHRRHRAGSSSSCATARRPGRSSRRQRSPPAAVAENPAVAPRVEGGDRQETIR